MKEKILEYGIRLCDNIMKNCPEGILTPDAVRFNYHSGVLLSGMEKMGRLVNKERYENYIRLWLDHMIAEDGTVKDEGRGWCSLESLDFRQPGVLLFPVYRNTKDERYVKAMKYLVESLKEFPVTQKGSFWHAIYFPNEVWLDGLYMASPVMTMYAAEFNRPEFFDMAAKQVLTMYESMKDERGLLYHGYDCTKQAAWADAATGRSHEVWGRAMGWFVMAIAEILEYLPKEHKDYLQIVKIEQETLSVVCNYQHESGRWYQVLDKPEDKRNWLENSASGLITAALAKAIRMGILPDRYLENMERGLKGVLNTVRVENDQVIVPDICVGTCIESGTMEYYCSRPAAENDMHGTGAFLIMLAEAGRLLTEGITEKRD